MWHAMMSQMAPRNQAGDYVRPESSFRGRQIVPEAGRYRLIVGMSCPWAHRTLVTRALKGLEDAIAITTVYPSTDEGMWLFDTDQSTDQASDLLLDCRSLPEFYGRAELGYKGRSTVPVLWDSKTNTIVNNESAEIIELLNSEFGELATGVDLYPAALREEIDSLNQKIYDTVNNGVYKCGFAQTQTAYDQAVTALFAL